MTLPTQNSQNPQMPLPSSVMQQQNPQGGQFSSQGSNLPPQGGYPPQQPPQGGDDYGGGYHDDNNGDDNYNDDSKVENFVKRYKKFLVMGCAVFGVLFLLWWLLGTGEGVIIAGKEHDERMSQEGGGITQEDITSRTIPDIAVMDVVAVDYSQPLLVTGTTAPFQETTITSEVGGRVVKKWVEENSKVAEGETIINFDEGPNPERLKAAREQVRLLKIQKNSEQQLAKEGLSSQLNMAQINSNLANAQAELAQQEKIVKELYVKAPFDGVVVDYRVEVGDYVGPSQPLAYFASLDKLYVDVFLSSDKARSVSNGLVASVTIDGISKQAVVDYVGAVSDQQTSTVKVQLLMDNQERNIKGQVPALVELRLPPVRASLIPSTALSLDDSGQVGVKYLMAGNQVGFQQVEVLHQDAKGLWVTGLPEKLALLSDGQAFVAAGQVINPVRSPNNLMMQDDKMMEGNKNMESDKMMKDDKMMESDKMMKDDKMTDGEKPLDVNDPSYERKAIIIKE